MTGFSVNRGCLTCKSQIALAGDNTDNLSPILVDRYCEPKGPKKSESMPNCHAKLSQETMKRAALSSDESQRPINVQALDQSEGKVTVNSIENVSLNDKNGTKDDLRKYVKMVSPIERSN